VKALAAGFASALLALGCGGGARDVLLVTTTSTQDSGLMDVLVPAFERASGYHVKLVAVGSGEALAMGARGEADVLLTHSPAAEEEWMAAGNGADRLAVMHNDFVLVGPRADPAALRGGHDAALAFQRLAAAAALFASRADDSGTHRKELALWKKAGLEPAGSWYVKAGLGQAETLRLASERGAYALTDRGTFRAVGGTLALELLVDGDPLLLNPYHVMPVAPARSGRINAAGGRAFADWIVGDEAQALIARFGVDRFGEPLFWPDAKAPSPSR